MKWSFIVLFWLLNFGYGFSQEIQKPLYYHIGAYADIGGEFIYIHYAKIGFQKYITNKFSVQGAFKIGSRSVTRWYIPSDRDGVPTNWINWHIDNPGGNPFFLSQSTTDPEKYGISTFPIQDHSFFYSNLTLTTGFDISLPFKTKLQILAGLGLRYTDEHDVGESGDAIFEYLGTEYEIYYLVPIYNRGIDAHFNGELNLVVPISENITIKGGLISDFTPGFLPFGVGNYYHVGTTLQIKIK